MSNFRIGQKVVLVDDGKGGDGDGVPRAVGVEAGAVYPTKGTVYTVRTVRLSSVTCTELLLLREIDNSHVAKPLGLSLEPGFASRRFRPVVERGTDAGMSILRNLLNKQSKTVREDA